jgi:hypothetical protein
MQHEISFRVYFYCLLTRSRVMPSLIIPPTAPLGGLTSFQTGKSGILHFSSHRDNSVNISPDWVILSLFNSFNLGK